MDDLSIHSYEEIFRGYRSFALVDYDDRLHKAQQGRLDSQCLHIVLSVWNEHVQPSQETFEV